MRTGPPPEGADVRARARVPQPLTDAERSLLDELAAIIVDDAVSEIPAEAQHQEG